MYSGYNGPAARTQRFFTYSNTPITLALVIAAAAHFVFNFYTRGLSHPLGRLSPWFLCDLPTLTGQEIGATTHFARLWTLITYPIAQLDPISTLFLCLWLYGIGGSLERSWGRSRYATFWLLLTLATSLTLLLGTHLLKMSFPLYGLTLPLVGITVAWAALNPEQELIFMFVIKLKAWMLAALVIGMMLFLDFSGAPVLGLFALVNPLFAYYWTRGRINLDFGSLGGGRNRQARRGPDLRFVDVDKPKKRGQPLDDLRGKSARGPLGAYQDWRQRKKLEKLWRDSGFTDKDDSERKR